MDPTASPLVDESCEEAVTIAMFNAIAADPALPGIVMLPMLCLDTAFAAALLSVRKPLYVHSGHLRAVARTGLHGQAYLERTLTASRRKRLRQQRAQLARRGEIALQVARAPGDVAAALETFLALEAGGWKGAAGTALACSEETAALARGAVLGLAGRGDARIVTLTCGGRPVAALVVLLGRGTAWLWKIAYDEAFAACSPGKHVFIDTVAMLLDEEPGRIINSCATPDHPLANLVLGERVAMGDVVVSAGGRAGPAFRLANLLERLRAGARAIKHRLRG